MNQNLKLGLNNLIVIMIVITIGLGSTLGVNSLFEKLSSNLDEKISNNEMQITIGRYILSHLGGIEKRFYEIAIGKDSNLSSVIQAQILTEIEHLKESFDTLSNGGYITHHIELNIVNRDKYEERLYYEPKDNVSYSLEAIDLNPKLDQLTEKLSELVLLIDRYENSVEAGNHIEKEKISKELDTFMKVMPTLFIRMEENASRMIYESRMQADEYNKRTLAQKELFSFLELGISILIWLTVMVFGYRSGKAILDINAKLSTLVYEAEEANIAKSMFLANMSHEIRTPLHAILGFAQLLEESEALPEKEKEHVKIIARSGNSLLEIINDILDLSKIESGSFKLENVSFNLLDLIEELIELYSIRAREKNIKIMYQPDMQIPYFVFGDPVRLRQVLTNLLSNAIKFTDEGGRIHLDAKVKAIHQDIAEIHIAVADNGVGISEEDHLRIFKAFEQAETGTNRKFGGTGLGLSITSCIVEAFGSKLKLESEEGKGSCFSFDVNFKIDHVKILERREELWDINIAICCQETAFPEYRERITHYAMEYGRIIENFDKVNYNDLDVIFVFYNHDIIKRFKYIKETYPDVPVVYVGDINKLSMEEASYVHDVIDEPIYGSKVKSLFSRYFNSKVNKQMNRNCPQFKGQVLIAEDNIVNQQLIEIIMQKFGINAYFASDGEEAITLYKRLEPDLIFMDLHMPILDGLESSRQIKSLMGKGMKKVPIIALTADVFREDREEMMREVFTDILAKPVVISQLQDVLSKHLLSDKIGERSQSKETFYVKEEKLYNVQEVLEEMFLDEGDLMMLLDSFFMELNHYIQAIKEAHASKDKAGLKVAIHSLKGTSGNLRFKQAAERLAEIEENVEAENFDISQIAEIETYFSEVKKEVDASFRSI